MNGNKITKVIRVFFGVFMICVYLGMASLMAFNFFDWSNTTMWKCVRWGLAVVFAAYGCYRCYRQIKGIDYYHHER